MEKLAAGTLSKQLFQCSHLSLLVAATPARIFKAARPETAFAGNSFFSGSYVRRNLAGLSNHARDYPNVTAYLTDRGDHASLDHSWVYERGRYDPFPPTLEVSTCGLLAATTVCALPLNKTPAVGETKLDI